MVEVKLYTLQCCVILLLKKQGVNCVLIPDKHWSLKSHCQYVHPVLEKLKATINTFAVTQKTERLITAQTQLLSKALAAAYLKSPKIKNLKHSFWTSSLKTTTKIRTVSTEELFFLKYKLNYSQFCCFPEHLPNYSSFRFQPSVPSLFFSCQSQPLKSDFFNSPVSWDSQVKGWKGWKPMVLQQLPGPHFFWNFDSVGPR